MALVRVDLDTETYQRLMDVALSERRPVPLQAEVVLRRALGLPFPYARPSGRVRVGDAPTVGILAGRREGEAQR